MSFLSSLIYDKFMAPHEEAYLNVWRRELLNNISGDVLELGAGTGANIQFYPENLSSLVLTEPDKYMYRLMEKRITSTNYPVSVLLGSAENIDAKDEAYDHVVVVLVCCTVSNIDEVLLEIKRVLKPGGSLIFLEHVGAPKGTAIRRWQDIFNPLWKLLAENCHLNRDTESAILSAGFKITTIKRQNTIKFLSAGIPSIHGVALKC